MRRNSFYERNVDPAPSDIRRDVLDHLLGNGPPRKPSIPKEVTFELSDGVLSFRKKEMRGPAFARPKSTIVIDKRPTPIIAGPAAPLEGILAALPPTAPGMIVRHAIEKGSVTWTPTAEAFPKLSTKESRDPLVKDTTRVRATYQRIAKALIAEINETRLRELLEDLAASASIAPGIFHSNFTAFGTRTTAIVAEALGKFAGFSHLAAQHLFVWLGLLEATRCIPAAELQVDVNWCRVLQDREATAPERSFYTRYDAPAIAPCWVRARYRASSSAVEALANAHGIPASVKADLPAISLAFDRVEVCTGLRWMCASRLRLETADGKATPIETPLRLADHPDIAESFDTSRRQEFLQLANESAVIAMHPTGLNGLASYVRLNDESFAHALLDVIYEHSDPGELMTHLDDGIEEHYWTRFPIRPTYRAALLVASRITSSVDHSVAAAIVSTLSKLAHFGASELQPLLHSGRSCGLDDAELNRVEALIADIQRAASASSIDKFISHEAACDS